MKTNRRKKLPVQEFIDVLSPDLISRVRAFSQTQEVHKVNLTSWDPNVVGASGAIMLFDLSGALKDEVIKSVRHLVTLPKGKREWVITFTLGSRLSFIPWHDDSCYVCALTVYTNAEWSRDWGGAFLYEDGPDVKALYPSYNKAVVLYPPVRHCTTMPTINAPLRESIQIFVK